jgi:hypothetical protein
MLLRRKSLLQSLRDDVWCCFMENTNYLKYCPGCKVSMSVDRFHKNKSLRDGLFQYCKECNKSRTREYRHSMKKREPHEVPTPDFKTCHHCQEIKPRDQFWVDREKRDGLYQLCKACRAIEHRKTYIKTIRPRLRSIVAARYGITADIFDSMISSQGGKCPICQREFSASIRTRIDHCHTSAKVRGILCPSCNQGLGLFHDSTERMHRAIQYLLQRRPG